MLTLSKPISAGQTQAYHKSEFANAKENYYTEGERVRGVWQGQLAERWNLKGEVNEEQFAGLSEGQHSATGEALIRRQQAREFVNERGGAHDGASGGAGRDVLGSEICLGDGPGWRRRPGQRRAPGERARGSGRDGKVRPGAHRRQRSGADDGCVGSGQVRA